MTVKKKRRPVTFTEKERTNLGRLCSCPITGGCPTSMTLKTFSKMCKQNQRKANMGAVANFLPKNNSACQYCQERTKINSGKDFFLKNLTIIEINQSASKPPEKVLIKLVRNKK